MQPITLRPDSEYWKAFAELMGRIEAGLGSYKGPPVPVYLAGGAAAHLYTGARYSNDVDATVALRRFLFPENLTVTYRGSDGLPRTLYFDKQYNDTLGILHEDAHRDSISIEVPGVNRRRLDIRILTPVDLALTKLARFGDSDREDIRALAKAGLITAKALRGRAEEALVGYIGRVNDVKISLASACRIVEEAAPAKPRRGR